MSFTEIQPEPRTTAFDKVRDKYVMDLLLAGMFKRHIEGREFILLSVPDIMERCRAAYFRMMEPS